MQTFKNVRIWDGTGDALIDADSLTMDAGRIVAVGEPPVPLAPHETRDMRGATVIPGLIDAHVHMVLDPEIKQALEQDQVTPQRQHAALRERALAMLEAGITTARDLGGGAWLELDLRDAIAAGDTPGPRLVCAGQPITSPQGHCHFWGGEAADLNEALEVLRRQVEHKVDLIKVMATVGTMTPNSRPVDAQFDEATIAGIADEATRCGHHVAAHCHGTAGIKNAVRAGVRTIEHCSWVGSDGLACHRRHN
jgi:imidazolonepropionase-like amidohydrolase